MNPIWNKVLKWGFMQKFEINHQTIAGIHRQINSFSIHFSCNLSFPFQKNNSRFWLSSSSDDKLKYESLMFLFRFGWEDKLDISWAIFSEFTKERMREKWIENELIHFLNSSPKMWINSHSHSSWKKWINSHSKMNWNGN